MTVKGGKEEGRGEKWKEGWERKHEERKERKGIIGREVEGRKRRRGNIYGGKEERRRRREDVREKTGKEEIP